MIDAARAEARNRVARLEHVRISFAERRGELKDSARLVEIIAADRESITVDNFSRDASGQVKFGKDLFALRGVKRLRIVRIGDIGILGEGKAAAADSK